MKKRTKIIGGIVGGIFVLGVIANIGDDNSSTTQQTTATPAATQETPKTETPAPTPKQEVQKITLADYDAIVIGDTLTGEGGATYDELVSKFGKPSTESNSQSGDMKMIFVSWHKNISGDFGANMSVTFMEKDGQKRASSKSQYGMK